MSARVALLCESAKQLDEERKSVIPQTDIEAVQAHARSVLSGRGVLPKTTLIEELIAENEGIWNIFLNNQWCLEGAISTDAQFAEKFRLYSEQDYQYLLEYAAFKAYRALYRVDPNRSAGLLTAVSTTMAKDVQSAEAFKQDLINQGVVIHADAEQSQGLIAYTRWQQLSATTGDPFSATVLMVPCVYGWNKIALHLQKLEQDGEIQIVKDTLFYKNWYYPNLDPKYADRINAQLEKDRINFQSPYLYGRWKELFRNGCQMELGLFQSPYVKF